MSGLLWLVLSVVSLWIWNSEGQWSFHMPYGLELMIIAADLLLLAYFAYQGRVHKNRKVLSLALLQILLFLWVEAALPEEYAAALIVDRLASFMFLIINIIGGAIVLYAIRYMDYEEMSKRKQRLFVVFLTLFLSVMNLIVMSNSLMLFFFLFEATTLSSYLLIRFRGDETAHQNALKALWMNQVGGVVILLGTLVAIYGPGTIHFDTLIHSTQGAVILTVSLLSMAALVKGAQIPFDGWLLGAMVAPTPVSAILHSATMVKIAPWLILKLSPVLAGSSTGVLLSTLGGFVFAAASYLALSRSLFKEIMGYSTIALLGLMIALAALGTPEAMTLAMVLILFHALSKALLFLSAGTIEKLYHLKDTEEMKGLIAYAPQSARFILFGFVSLTLPPFGLFIVKLFAIEELARLLQNSPALLPLLLLILLGSTLLVLLYFKVTAAILSRPDDLSPSPHEEIPLGFAVPLWALTLLILLATLQLALMQNITDLSLFFIPPVIIVIAPVIFGWMHRFDRVKPYHCGERNTFDAALFYYGITEEQRRVLYIFFIFLFVSLALTGVFS
jgi:ech hydrogenase subunit A